MKTIVVHKHFGDTGGVGGMFATLRKYFSNNIDHFECGSRTGENAISMFIRFVRDNILFTLKLFQTHYDVVHINISLDIKSLWRDGIFLLIARIRCKKIITYIHGWDVVLGPNLHGLGLFLFRYVFDKSTLIIVLAEQFKSQLLRWHFTAKITTMYTAVDNDLLNNFSIAPTTEMRLNAPVKKILFLSRLDDIEKGMYQTIDAFAIVRQKIPTPLELIIAGDGTLLNDIKCYVAQKQIPDIVFPGYVRGEHKAELFSQAYLYCLPTYYSEGLPISILEAMAFGLPVVTRCAGGVGDFFINNEHGFITASVEPEQFAEYMTTLLSDTTLYKKIATTNYDYAQEHFMASKIAKELETIYTSLGNS